MLTTQKYREFVYDAANIESYPQSLYLARCYFGYLAEKREYEETPSVDELGDVLFWIVAGSFNVEALGSELSLHDISLEELQKANFDKLNQRQNKAYLEELVELSMTEIEKILLEVTKLDKTNPHFIEVCDLAEKLTRLGKSALPIEKFNRLYNRYKELVGDF